MCNLLGPNKDNCKGQASPTLKTYFHGRMVVASRRATCVLSVPTQTALTGDDSVIVLMLTLCNGVTVLRN